MNEKNQTKKLPGFYIALCCCVIAVGVAGAIVQNTETQTTNSVTTATQTAEPLPVVTPEIYFAQSETDTEITPPSTESAETNSNAVTDMVINVTETPSEAYTVDNPDVEPASVTVQAEESSTLANPVPDMTVLCGYSGETLMYNEILGDWRTHNGVDVAADVGSSVSAAADGTVSFVGTTEYGKTIKIAHENGLETVYSQLNETNVSEGDNVTQNSVIGTIGESMGENTREAHLHFEVHKDGKAVDPIEF